jgi:hypothetical protein
MTSNTTNSSPIVRLIPVLIFAAGLIALYYLYQYLFGPKSGQSFPLITKTVSALSTISPIQADKLPVMYEGGEFTVSTWIYVNDWGQRRGYNKSILSIGGKAFDTIRIYLGGYKPRLMVRFHTREPGTVPDNSNLNSSSGGSSMPSGKIVSTTPDPITINQSDDLSVATQNSTFNNKENESELLDTSFMCDLPEVNFQRWVNITIAANGKTVDVYLDGKLSRSCVLPRPFKVDNGYNARLLEFGGFGGQISTTTMYDAALNPEAVYKNYMAGPEPITSIGDWFMSVFAPGVSVSVTTN